MSPNFAFLAKHHPLLVHYAAKAERAMFDDPNDALIRLRQFGEILCQLTCGHLGVELLTSRTIQIFLPTGEPRGLRLDC